MMCKLKEVPRVPTREMIEAAMDKARLPDIWAAMWDAAEEEKIEVTYTAGSVFYLRPSDSEFLACWMSDNPGAALEELMARYAEKNGRIAYDPQAATEV